MRPKPWYLGAAYLLLALIIACDGGDSPQATVPPNVQEASYSATTQTLTLTLSDGTTVQADLRELATDADLQKKRESALSLVKASFDHDTRVLTLTLSDGSSVETNLGPSLSAAHLEQIASKILDALPRETEITVEDIQRILKIAVAEAVLELTIGAEATYDPKTETLILFLGDGATIQADLGSLVTDADFEASLARLQTTSTPTPIAVVTLPPSITGRTPRPTPGPTARPSTGNGVLDVGMTNLGPYVGTLYDAGYFQNRYAELVTHETLFVMGFDGEWGPRLVKDFHISPDALTYTLNLQEGARWHDVLGDWGEFTSEDFVWSIQEVSHEGSAHVQAGNTRRLFACEGCRLTRIDDYTVELKRPSPTFQLTWFSQAPIPGFSMNSKKHFDAVGREAALLQDVGTGAWEQVEYVTDVRRRVRAVRDHWRHAPEFDEMIWHDIPRESVRLANFLVGELDTGIFNADSRRAIQDAISAGDQRDTKFAVYPVALMHMLWHEGGHYTPDSPYHRPDSQGYVFVPIDGFYGDYRNICDDSRIVNGVATPMSSEERRPWISCDRDVNSPEWERARKVREAMLRAINREAIINNIAFGEGEPWYIGYWANRGRMQQMGLDRLGPGPEVDFWDAQAGLGRDFAEPATCFLPGGKSATQDYPHIRVE